MDYVNTMIACVFQTQLHAIYLSVGLRKETFSMNSVSLTEFTTVELPCIFLYFKTVSFAIIVCTSCFELKLTVTVTLTALFSKVR